MTWGVDPNQLTKLAGPTPDAEKKTRPAPGGGNKMLTYIDARYVMEVLDGVCGPENWQNQFHLDANNNLTCGIGILAERPNGVAEWVWKWDVGTESTIEATKGNYSDAFKRAAVHWGIARDLYDDRTAVPGSFKTRGATATAAPARQAAHPTAPLVSDWRCPIHGSYKVIPAGTTKAGKPYPAFIACGAPFPPGCNEKPPRGTQPIQSAAPVAAGYVGMADDLDEDDDNRLAWREGDEDA